jgi:choline dehydrogenase-like flavoprotein
MIKIRDGLGGTLTNNGWIKKPLSKNDVKRLDKGAEHAKRILKNAGATDIYKSWRTAAHPGGTVKIGEQLDSNLKTKFDNLYVCDCSVVPEEWGLPPTTTLVALGKRLAKHLFALESPTREEDLAISMPAFKQTDVTRLAAAVS